MRYYKYIFILLILLGFGCATAKAVIPPEPKFQPVTLYERSDGSVCMGRDDFIGLQKNVIEMKKY